MHHCATHLCQARVSHGIICMTLTTSSSCVSCSICMGVVLAQNVSCTSAKTADTAKRQVPMLLDSCYCLVCLVLCKVVWLLCMIGLKLERFVDYLCFYTMCWCIPVRLLNRPQKFELLWLLVLRFRCRTLLTLLGLIDLQQQG